MLRSSLTVIALLAAACGSDDRPQGPAQAEVVLYDYAFDMETLAATSALTLRVTQEGNCFSLPLRAGGLADVTLDGKAISDGGFEGGVLEACGDGWDVDDEVILAASITVPEETWEDSQVGYSIWTDLEGNPFTYLVSWVGGCDRFGPCDITPGTFAHYRMSVTHPGGTEVLCPGTITAGDTLTTCEFSLSGGPTYSTFAFAASPSWTRTELGNYGGVDLVLYDTASSGTAAAFDADYAGGFLQWMQDKFGPYPYGDELRFAVAPTYWNGFEHPGNIVLADTLTTAPSSYSNPLEHTVDHEMAHMWAGDQTTLAGTYDFAWKEAMAEYLAFAYDDENDPAVATTTAFAWKAFSTVSEYYPVPEDQPPLLTYYGDVYGPTPIILFRQLEGMFGRDAIFDALGMLLGTERALSMDDVQAALEQATGADLTGYFDTWIRGSGAPVYPTYDMSFSDNGDGSYDVTIAQQNPELGLYGGGFYIGVRGANSGELQHEYFDMGVDGTASKTVTVTPGFAVTSLSFDSKGHTLGRGMAVSAAPAAAPKPERVNPWVVPAAYRGTRVR